MIDDDDSAPAAEGKTAQAIVRQALADLPGHQRTLLMLICVDRMTYKQTAELLDIAVGTVAAKIARARHALDEQIALRSRRDVVCSTIEFSRARAEAEGERYSC